MSWAWEQDYVEKLPRFPKPKPQRDVAGRHYLTKSDLNALYFATHQLPRPRGCEGITSAFVVSADGGSRLHRAHVRACTTDYSNSGPKLGWYEIKRQCSSLEFTL